MGTFKTLRRPSSLSQQADLTSSTSGGGTGGGSSSYHLFRQGITPAWEDQANARGGRWTFTLPLGNPALLDRSWTWLVLALIGEQLAPELVTQEEDDMDLVTGAVVTVRPGLHRLALWVRSFEDPRVVAGLNRVAHKAVEAMDLTTVPGVKVQFLPHAKPASWATDKEQFWSLTTSLDGGARPTGGSLSSDHHPSSGSAMTGSWRSSGRK